MNWYFATLTRKHGAVCVYRGWMLAASDNELVDYARTMHYGIDIRYIGPADMTAVTPAVLGWTPADYTRFADQVIQEG